MRWSVGLQAAWYGWPFPEGWTVGQMRAHDFGFDVDPTIPDEAIYIAVPMGFDYGRVTGYTWSADPGFMFTWRNPLYMAFERSMIDAIAREIELELDRQILDELYRGAGGKPPPRKPEPPPMVML